jgi:putative DNA primase/helicase
MIARRKALTPHEVSTYYATRVPLLRRSKASSEWRGPCPIHQGKSDNFSVKPATGQWFCHSACNMGGGIFKLEQKLGGSDLKSATQAVYDIVGTGFTGERAGSSPTKLKVVSLRSSNTKSLDIAKVRKSLAREGFEVAAIFSYGPDLRKIRFEHRTRRQDAKNRPEKTFRWEHRKDETWQSGDGGLAKPLYVNRIFRERADAGLAVGFEGETKADHAATLGLAAFSFKEMTAEQAESLDGCDVVLWPDNDASGTEQVAKATQILLNFAYLNSLMIVSLPDDFPPAGDLIDATENLGWDKTKILDLIEAAKPPKASEVLMSTCGLGIHTVDYSEPLADREDVTPAITFPFLVRPDGIFFRRDADGTADPVRISSRIDVVAKTRNHGSDEWGRVLAWKDEEGRHHQWAMPMEFLACDAAGVRARLLAGGLPFISTNSRMRERFSEYLQTAPTDKYIRCVSRIGWSGNSFVLPDMVIGPKDGEQLLYQPANDSFQHYWHTRGTAEEWKENVGSLCRGNSRLVVAVACGFAGPLLALVGSESGGIHFHGGSSTGKSTALLVGGSVCGGGGQLGFVQTWRSTVNGLEVMAEGHNDGTLFLDELAQVDPHDAAETAYMLGNGQGKSRMTKSIGARKRMTWGLLIVSSGEVTLAEHASSAGKRTRAGVEMRLVNIDADAGREMGIIEELNSMPSSEALVSHLRDAAQKYYGTVFRVFLEILTQHRSEVEAAVAEAREALKESLPPGAVGEVRRVAERLAIIAAAGTLATKWRLTGWSEADAIEGARKCLSAWIAKRGNAASSDVEAALAQLRAFLERHGSSRFQIMNPKTVNAGDAARIANRAGFLRRAGEETEYLVLRDTFRTEICCGFDHRAVAKELSRRGFLVRQDTSMTIKARLPEIGGTTRVYCIRAAILDGEC